MKFLVVLALFAAAAAEPEAEADPYYFYNGYTGYPRPYTYGHGFPYHTYHHVPAVKAVENTDEAVPAVVEKKAAVVAPYYYTHPYAAYTFPHTYAYNHVKPYTYYANSGGAVHVVKREAEAESEADPKSWYGYHGYSPYTYGYGNYGTYGHTYGAYSPYRVAYYRYGAYSPYTHGGYSYGK